MRVLIVTENFLPKVDGVTRTLARLLEHLHTSGHQVMLFGPDSSMTTYAGAALVGTAGIPFYPYPELKLNLWRPAFTRQLLLFEPHVIHLVDPVWLGAAALAICRLHRLKVPLVASYHTNLATYCTHFGWGILNPLMWRWNLFCHSQCRYTVCPSRSTAQILASQGFKDVRIWPRGVDTSLFSPDHRSHALRAQWMGLPEDTHSEKAILLYVGRVSFEKNLDLVIDAYKEMDHQQCHLVIVGHGPALEEIQSDCLRTNTPITFTGYLHGAELATAFASADIFAFPSRSETFGQVVLEAMASGLPVVGLQAEGVCDLVSHQHTGLLLDTDGFSSLEQRNAYLDLLMQLIRNNDTRRQMGRHAIASAGRYTWWEAMECVVQTYWDAASELFSEEDLRPSVDLEHGSGDSGVGEIVEDTIEFTEFNHCDSEARSD